MRSFYVLLVSLTTLMFINWAVEEDYLEQPNRRSGAREERVKREKKQERRGKEKKRGQSEDERR